jgi:hypothetical protein
MIDIINRILKVFDENHLWDNGVELVGSWRIRRSERKRLIPGYSDILPTDMLMP